MKWLPFGYLLAAILALAACQAHGPTAPPRIEIREVAVPTPVACVPANTPEHQPARTATPEALGHSNLDDMLAAITAELVRRRAYDDQVEPVLTACRAAAPDH